MAGCGSPVALIRLRSAGRRQALLGTSVALAVALAVFGVVLDVVAPHRLAAVPFDRDGDGRSDLLLWVPENGRWELGPDRMTLGAPDHVPVPADWDGDGLVDPGVWQPATGSWVLTGRSVASIGLAGDVPVPCAWHRPDRPAPAIWRPSTGGWFDVHGLITILGGAGDLPVPEDWAGDGTCRPAVFRPVTGEWLGTDLSDPFGLLGDVPVAGRWLPEGGPQRAVWRPSTGAWIVERDGRPEVLTYLGLPGDQPVPADWDGDGRLEPAVWRPDSGTLWLTQEGPDRLGTPGAVAVLQPPSTRLAMADQAPEAIDDLGPPPASAPAEGSDRGTGTAADPRRSLRRLVAVALVLLAAALVRREAGRRAAGLWEADQAVVARNLLLLAAVTLPLSGWRLGPASVGDAFLGATLITGVGALARRGPPGVGGVVRGPVGLGAALAAAGGIVGGLVGPTSFDWLATGRAMAGVAVPVLAVAMVCPRPQERVELALAYAGGAAVSATLGLLGASSGLRGVGLATHPNHLGLSCLLGVALAGGVLAARGPRWAGPVLVLNVGGVLLSGSRSALIGLVALGGWWAWRTRGGDRRPNRRVALLGAVALAGAALVAAHGTALSRLGGDPASDAGRRFLLEVSADRLQRWGLTGSGFELLEEAHSMPLQLLVAGGPLLLLGGGLLLAAPLAADWARRHEPLDRWLLAGWSAYLLSSLVQNIVVDRYLWFVAALLIVASGRPGGRARPPRRPDPRAAASRGAARG